MSSDHDLHTMSVPLLPTQHTEQSVLYHLGTLSTLAFRDHDDAIRLYLTASMRLLQMHTAWISCAYADHHRAAVVVDAGRRFLHAETTFPLDELFARDVLASRYPIAIGEAGRDPRGLAFASHTATPIGSYIGVPIYFLNGVRYGTLCLVDADPHVFTGDHVAILRIIARSIAAGIKNAHHDAATQATAQAHQAVVDTLESQTRIAKVVAHDARSPLLIIDGYADLMREEYEGTLTDDQVESLDHIQAASQFINRLLSDLMNINTVGQQGFSLVLTEFDVVELAQQLVASHQRDANRCGIAVSLSDAPPTCIITSDRDRLSQIMRNLMSNALTYTPSGWVKVGIAIQGAMVAIQIEDSGVGIAPDLQDQIWEWHRRGTTRGEGFGIGLYVVRQLVEAMGGTIIVESDLGQGSRFIVRLPWSLIPTPTAVVL